MSSSLLQTYHGLELALSQLSESKDEVFQSLVRSAVEGKGDLTNFEETFSNSTSKFEEVSRQLSLLTNRLRDSIAIERKGE